MNPYSLSRRRFLKQTSLGTAGLALAGNSLRVFGADNGGVSIVTFPDDRAASAVPPQWAISQLKQALEAHRINVRVVSSLAQAPAADKVVVVASAQAPVVQEILKGTGLKRPSSPESIFLTQGAAAGRSVLLACGNEARSLVYAVLELADRVNCSDSAMTALEVSPAIVEQPANKTRSMCRSFQSEVEDKPWFNDRGFWTDYLTTLVSERFNRFNLSFGNGYNSTPGGSPEVYLFFAYPFLVLLTISTHCWRIN